MTSISKHLRPLAVAAAMAVAFGACDENLNGGIACPALCPGQGSTLSETTFFAVDLDSSIAGFPQLGGELEFYVANMGDTLETAVALRFDTLPQFWRRINAAEDSAITYVDTGSHIRLTLLQGDTLGPPTTIEMYDIDMEGVEDNDPLAVTAAFTPERLLTTITVPADSLRDSLRIPIDPSFVLGKIVSVPNNRMRLGIRVTQAGNPRLRVVSTNGNGAAQLVFRPSPDTAVAVPTMRFEPFSKAPPEPFLSSDQADYLVVLKEPPAPPSDVMRLGGLPVRRIYLRFNIPSFILDSTNVVRATLFVTQRPNPFSPNSTDTLGIGHFGIISGTTVTDLTRALFFITRPENRDTVFMTPSDSGERSFEMIDWVRAWRGTKPELTPRAMALVSASEEEVPLLLDFYSIEALPSVRPRLRLTYLPRKAGPLP